MAAAVANTLTSGNNNTISGSLAGGSGQPASWTGDNNTYFGYRVMYGLSGSMNNRVALGAKALFARDDEAVAVGTQADAKTVGGKPSIQLGGNSVAYGQIGVGNQHLLLLNANEIAVGAQATRPSLGLQAATGRTGSIQEWLDAAGALVAKVDADGSAVFAPAWTDDTKPILSLGKYV